MSPTTNSWNSFVASSFVVPTSTSSSSPTKTMTKHHQLNSSLTSGGSLFGLQQALSSNANNNSHVAVPAVSSASPSEKTNLPSSFFIAKKGDLLLSSNKSSPPLSSSSSSTSQKMKDVALKHLFQPELVSAAVSAATTMNSFLLKSSEVSAIASSGITPLKNAPLRLGVRKRLGLALLNQKTRRHSSNSPFRNHDDDEEDGNDDENVDQNPVPSSAVDVLRYVGNRILLMKSDLENPFPQTSTTKATTRNDGCGDNHGNHQPLPTAKSQQGNQKITSSSTIEGIPSKHSHYSSSSHDEQETERQSNLEKHIEQAASRAKSMSYAQLYEQSVERERKQKQQPTASPQEKLRLLQQEQEELENQKMFDGREYVEIVSSKNENNNNTNGQKQKQIAQSDSQFLLPSASGSSSSPVPRPTRQVDRTGDFKTPLTAARLGLQSAYQNLEQDHGIPAHQVSYLSKFQNNKNNATTRNLSSTVTYLQGKFDLLSQVSKKIEEEEHKMRLATATILAEILALKKLEDAAKSEALSWIEYAEDLEDGESQNQNISDISWKREQAFEACSMAKDFLIDLE